MIFFENSLIYNLSILNIKILDINMNAHYGNEKSNLNVFSTGFMILYKYIKLFLKNLI